MKRASTLINQHFHPTWGHLLATCYLGTGPLTPISFLLSCHCPLSLIGCPLPCLEMWGVCTAG